MCLPVWMYEWMSLGSRSVLNSKLGDLCRLVGGGRLWPMPATRAFPSWVPTTGMLVTLWCHVRGGRHVSQIGGGSLVAGTQACVWGVFMCRATPSIIKIISIINYHNHPNTSVKCSPHTSQCHVLGSSKELPADRTGKFLFKLYMYIITMASLF